MFLQKALFFFLSATILSLMEVNYSISTLSSSSSDMLLANWLRFYPRLSHFSFLHFQPKHVQLLSQVLFLPLNIFLSLHLWCQILIQCHGCSLWIAVAMSTLSPFSLDSWISRVICFIFLGSSSPVGSICMFLPLFITVILCISQDGRIVL